MRRRFAFVVASTWLLESVAAHATERLPRFTWDAPEGCPSSEQVASRIAARVRHPRSAGDVRAQVESDANGVRVRVVIEDMERTIVAPTCEGAADAVAVIVALALEG